MKNLKYYFPGKGCKCFACCKEECGCQDVDWTPKEVYVLRDLLQEAVDCYIHRDAPSEEWRDTVRNMKIDNI